MGSVSLSTRSISTVLDVQQRYQLLGKWTQRGILKGQANWCRCLVGPTHRMQDSFRSLRFGVILLSPQTLYLSTCLASSSSNPSHNPISCLSINHYTRVFYPDLQSNSSQSSSLSAGSFISQFFQLLGTSSAVHCALDAVNLD